MAGYLPFGVASPQELADDDPHAGISAAINKILGGGAAMVAAPGQLVAPNPYPPGSEQASWYEDQRSKGMTDWAPQMAMSMVGGATPFGVPARAGEAVLGSGPIRAYHGSPHDFDAFDFSKIGTGEGAQAYGHGIYLAENEGTARSYRDALSRPTQENPLWKLNGEPVNRGTPHWSLADALDNVVMKPGEAVPDMLKRRIGELDDQAEFASKAYGPHVGEMYTNKADKLRSVDPSALSYHPPGHMYEVNINADPEHFLDWDKPLSEQHPQAQDAVKKAMGIDYYGKPDPAKAERMWQQFKHSDAGTAVRQGFIASDDKLVADRLNQAGIPGIKYLDQGSRGAGEGSRNYVVFNDKLIDILKKYGIAGILGGAGGVGALGQKDEGS